MKKEMGKKAESVIPECPRCGARLWLVKGKNYYGCPNWLPNGLGCAGTIWFPEGIRKASFPNKAFSCKIESRSNPGHFHIVVIYEGGDMDCPCTAGQMNKFCWHKQETIKRVTEILSKIKKENGFNKTVQKND